MKTSRIFLLIIAGIVVLVAAAVFYLVRNLDSLVASAIEKYGTEAAGTSVQVQAVEIRIREGMGSVRGLTVANPPGFTDRDIFSLGEIVLDLDAASLTSELPIVEEIRIGEPSLLFEVNESAKTNLDVLKQNVGRIGERRKKEGAEAEKDQPRLLVRRLTIEGGQGILDLTAVGGREVQAKLPPITLTDIGGEQGVTPTALGEAVLAALIKNLEQAAVRQGVEKAVRDRLGEEAGRLEEKLDEKVAPGAGEALKKMLGK
jgi:hypothetical protein